MELEYVELFLDSRDGVQNNTFIASTDWSTLRFDSPLTNIEKMKILQVEVPFSYYVITTSNNTFTLQEPGVGTVSISIPVGNYTTTTMATTLATLLTQASLLLGSRVYTVTFSTLIGKFTVSTNFGTLVLSVPTLSLQLILGLNQINTSTGVNLVFPNVAQITGDNYVYLNSDAIGNIFQTYLPYNAPNFSVSKGPQIARIPIDGNPGDIIFYQDPCPEKWFDTQNLNQLQSFDLYFTLGTSNEKLLFNGQNFSVKLGLLINPGIHSRGKQNASNTATKMVMG
ncbi:hypothetical protein QT971_06310 [Microcoleus sp. herbarium19]|uniref:hypothetical protein n=1 Tax=Microcoleus sp. herbarium19 TaxID=3055440 RepID=UPI002FD134DF